MNNCCKKTRAAAIEECMDAVAAVLRHNNNTDMELLTIQQTAKFIDMSILHVRKLLKQGIIPYVNYGLGKKREYPRIKKEDVEKFLSKGAKK